MRKYWLLLVFVFFLSTITYSQGFLKKLTESKAVSNIIDGNPAISTSFKDVYTKSTLPPSFGEGKTYVQLHTMPRDGEGNFILPPGFYETTNYSYCLKAGTPSPNVSDAYGLAPLDGKMADIVEAILVRSQQLWAGKAEEPADRKRLLNTVSGIGGIQQSQVQVLLWAIIAKANFSNLAGMTKATALALLTTEQIMKLNGGAIKTAANFATNKGLVDKPEAVRMVEQAIQSVRELCYRADATYEDFERAAIIAGLSKAPQISETGTFFTNPDKSFYIRFIPHGYSRTTSQIYVPEGNGPVKFRLTGMVATPDDSRQRLAQTDWSADRKPVLKSSAERATN